MKTKTKPTRTEIAVIHCETINYYEDIQPKFADNFAADQCRDLTPFRRYFYWLNAHTTMICDHYESGRVMKKMEYSDENV